MATPNALHVVLRRALNDGVTNNTTAGMSESTSSQTDSQTGYGIFILANLLLLVILVLVCCLCCRLRDGNYCSSGAEGESDLVHQRAVLERRRAAEDRRKETPEKRQALLASFKRNKVTMVSVFTKHKSNHRDDGNDTCGAM